MNSNYVLLTAAKDEAACMEEVIKRVIQQTHLPVAWFIMDDGSTDRTAAIIEEYAAKYSFIRLHSARSQGVRNFGSQYKALLAAYELARPMEFDFVAVQDADQAPERMDYYQLLIEKFQQDPRLGVVSGYVYERPRGYWEIRATNSPDSVAASAVFRRTCFESTGGYKPLVYGGSDWLIQLEVRMAGWKLLTLPDLHILPYRPTSSAGGIWRGLYRAGMMDASFGSLPQFELLKCCRRIHCHPFALGSLVRWAGYLNWKVRGLKPLIPNDAVAFLRKEQSAKLRGFAWPFGRTRNTPLNTAVSPTP